MGSMAEERCPWDSGSEDDEDEDWLYSSVSRYQHLLMCRLGVVGSCLAVSPSGKCMALAGKAGDREELAIYKMPGKLMADNPIDEGLTSSRDFGLLAGTVQAGKVDQLKFLGDDSVVVGQRGSTGASLWGWQDLEGDLVTCRQRWSQTKIECQVLEVIGKEVYIGGGGKVARLKNDKWEERQVTSASGSFTSLLPSDEECLWVVHSSGGVQMIDWRIPQDSISNTQTPNWNAKAGQSTLLVQSHENKCVMASLSPCGLLNLTSPTDRSPLGELRLPSTPSMAPAIPLLTRGNKDKLVASLGGDIWIIDIASLNIEFCHDGHRKKSKGNQVIHFFLFESHNLVFKVLGVAAHPRERMLLSSDSLGSLHAWQYNPGT